MWKKISEKRLLGVSVEDGPAIKRVGYRKEWYKDDKLHRDDGPAIPWAKGKKEY